MRNRRTSSSYCISVRGERNWCQYQRLSAGESSLSDREGKAGSSRQLCQSKRMNERKRVSMNKYIWETGIFPGPRTFSSSSAGHRTIPLSPSSAHQRVRTTMKGNYPILVKREKGRPWRICRGEISQHYMLTTIFVQRFSEVCMFL